MIFFFFNFLLVYKYDNIKGYILSNQEDNKKCFSYLKKSWEVISFFFWLRNSQLTHIPRAEQASDVKETRKWKKMHQKKVLLSLFPAGNLQHEHHRKHWKQKGVQSLPGISSGDLEKHLDLEIKMWKKNKKTDWDDKRGINQPSVGFR